MALYDGLVSYWTMDDPAGDVMRDSVGFHDAIRAAGVTAVVGGKVGNARDFDDDGRANVSAIPEFNVAGASQTVSMWLYPEVLPSARTAYVIRRGTTTPEVHFYTDSKLYWYFQSTGPVQGLASGALTANNWYHVVLVAEHVTGTTWNESLYINGSQVGSTVQTTNGIGLIGGGGVAWQFGEGGTYGPVARIDEVGLWNRVLSPTEITALYNSTNGLGPADIFGAAPLSWKVIVDWDADGLYESDESAKLMQVSRVSRGRQNYLSGDSKGFERMGEGTADLVLRNTDGRYDPWNTESAIYPNVQPGRYIQVKVLGAGVVKPIITGTIKDVVPFNENGAEMVRLTIADGADFLQEKTPTLVVTAAGGTDDLIEDVLDNVNWPDLWGHNLDASAYTIPYWWTDTDSALAAIDKLAAFEVGAFWIDASGCARFLSRDNLYEGTSLATLDGGDIGKDFILKQPWENLRNIIRIVAHPRMTQASVQVWQLGPKPSIENAASLTYWAEWGGTGSPVTSGTLVAAITANTAADGSGTDHSGDFTVTVTQYGQSAKLVITNGSGVTCYIIALTLTGTVIVETGAVTVSHDDSSGSLYGVRTMTLDNIWIQDETVAQTLANWLAPWLATIHMFPIVTFRGRPEIQFGYDLMDCLTLSIAAKGINTLFRIARIEHNGQQGGGDLVKTTMWLEPVVAA